jgi:hypothetical protein
MPQAKAAKTFEPVLMQPTQSAIDASSFLLISGKNEASFARNVAYAVSGERQPLSVFGRMLERAGSLFEAPDGGEPKSAWTEAIAFADKKLRSIGFEPANPADKIPMEFGRMGALSKAFVSFGALPMVAALARPEKISTPRAVAQDAGPARAVMRGFAILSGAGGLAYCPPIFGRGSDRVHVHVDGPAQTEAVLSIVGVRLKEAGLGGPGVPEHPAALGRAMGLLHESFHLFQDRCALESAEIRNHRAFLPMGGSSGVWESDAFMSAIGLVSIHVDALRKPFEPFIARKLRQASYERVAARRALASDFTKTLGESFADAMSAVALAAGEPRAVATVARAIAEWREIRLAGSRLPRSRPPLIARLMHRNDFDGDVHQTAPALRLLAQIADSMGELTRPTINQWSEIVKCCALSGMADWALEANSRLSEKHKSLFAQNPGESVAGLIRMAEEGQPKPKSAGEWETRQETRDAMMARSLLIAVSGAEFLTLTDKHLGAVSKLSKGALDGARAVAKQADALAEKPTRQMFADALEDGNAGGIEPRLPGFKKVREWRKDQANFASSSWQAAGEASPVARGPKNGS